MGNVSFYGRRCIILRNKRGYIFMWVLLSMSIVFVVMSAFVNRSLDLARRTNLLLQKEQYSLSVLSVNNYISNLQRKNQVVPPHGVVLQAGKNSFLIKESNGLIQYESI